MESNEARRVEALVTRWTQAISRGDRQAILAHHADDLLMFDFPGVVEGIEEYGRTWDFFYRSPKGPISFEPKDIRVTAGDEVAFVSCAIHCDGTSAGPLELRLTMGLEKRGNDWIITHEHHSVPTVEDRFIDNG